MHTATTETRWIQTQNHHVMREAAKQEKNETNDSDKMHTKFKGILPDAGCGLQGVILHSA